MQRKWMRLMAISMVLLLAVGLNGCKSKGNNQMFPGLDGIDTGSNTFQNGNTSGSGVGLPNVNLDDIPGGFSPSADLQPVYFNFDSYTLRSDALDTLRANARVMNGANGVLYQIAGHCDERGTQGYNLALGERRALAVREHLIKLGVAGDRLITISYGEEDPAAYGQDEQAWAKNRRCEFYEARGK